MTTEVGGVTRYDFFYNVTECNGIPDLVCEKILSHIPVPYLSLFPHNTNDILPQNALRRDCNGK